jgi:hypothetical protein
MVERKGTLHLSFGILCGALFKLEIVSEQLPSQPHPHPLSLPYGLSLAFRDRTAAAAATTIPPGHTELPLTLRERETEGEPKEEQGERERVPWIGRGTEKRRSLPEAERGAPQRSWLWSCLVERRSAGAVVASAPAPAPDSDFEVATGDERTLSADLAAAGAADESPLSDDSCERLFQSQPAFPVASASHSLL